MFIYARISWRTDLRELNNKPKVAPIFYAYYDSAHPYDNIPVIYMDKNEVRRLIEFYATNLWQGRSLMLDSVNSILHVSKKSHQRSIKTESIVCKQGEPAQYLFPINLEPSYIDVDVEEDDRVFSVNDIRKAVLYGIKTGEQVALSRTDQYQDKTPMDIAIFYAQGQEGA